MGEFISREFIFSDFFNTTCDFYRAVLSHESGTNKILRKRVKQLGIVEERSGPLNF